VFFVTRMKDNADYEVVEKRQVPEKGNVRSDEVIFFHRMAAEGHEHFFRRIEVWDEEKQRTLVFLTNHLTFGATTIAAIYKDRWKVELFFKAIKQNLKVKTFLGTSANAVHTQLWAALIAMLVLRYLQLKSTFGWSLSNLVAMLRLQLFVYRDLHAWLDSPFEAPPALGRNPRCAACPKLGWISWTARSLVSTTDPANNKVCDANTSQLGQHLKNDAAWISGEPGSENEPDADLCPVVSAPAQSTRSYLGQQ